jgi:WD40 repeat protein
MDTDDIVRRFRVERQALANLQHPNIARLLDGGTSDDGRPYLVMELVEGVLIDEHCRARDLDLEQRVELFGKVCDAVSHAHRNLIVHRDLKPSNVLVDASGEPKLLDFGVAKVLDPDTVGASLAVTGRSERLLTPRYASPEQVRGEPVTTATDVYALGVMLYELLAGRSPYALDTTSTAALERAICETDPARPSTAYATGTDTSTEQTRRMRRALRGDLDLIVLKALRKEPERRYATVDSMHEDLRRWLREEPISARPDSWSYRTGRFLTRHRTAAALVAVAAVALVATAAVAVGFAIRAERERQRADLRTADAEWNAYTGSMAAASSMVGPDPRAFRPEEAQRYLRAAPEARRGWEWDHLDAKRSRSLWQTSAKAHALSVDFSPDNRYVVTAQGLEDATLKTWDARTGELVGEFADGAEYEGQLTVVAWSPDGDRIATAGQRGVLQLWAPDGSAPLASVSIGSSNTHGLAFSTDGGRLLTSSYDGTLAAWSLEGDALRELWRAKAVGRKVGRRGRRTMTFTSDGERVVAGDDEGRLRLFVADTGRLLAEAAPEDARYIAAVRAVDDRVIALDYRTRIITLDPRTLEILDTVTPADRYTGAGGFIAAAISPSGKLAVREHHHFLALLDAETGRLVAMIRGPREKSGIADAVFSPDERRIAAVCRDSLRLHVLSVPPLPSHWSLGGKDARRIAFDRESRMLVRGSKSGAVEVHDVESGIRVLRVDAHSKPINAVAFVGDGSMVVSAGDEVVRWWDVRSGEMIRELDGFTRGGRGMAVDPSGTRLAHGYTGDRVRLVDAVTGDVIRELTGSGRRIGCVAFSPDGALVVAGQGGGRALLWETDTGRLLRDLGPLKKGPTDIVVTSDGRIVACHYGRYLYEWPPGVTEAIRRRYSGRVWDVGSLALSSDGTRLGTGASDHRPRVWAVDRMGDMLALELEAPTADVCFSPDGRYFAAASTGAMPVHVWSIDPPEARLAASTVRYWHDRLDGDWTAVRSEIERDPWLLDEDRGAALAIVDRLSR